MVNGKSLYSRRMELGLTQAEVAEITGVSHQTIHKWEKGKIDNMKVNNLRGLSKALRVDPLWLIGLDENDRECYKTMLEDEIIIFLRDRKDKIDLLTTKERRKLIDIIDVYLD